MEKSKFKLVQILDKKTWDDAVLQFNEATFFSSWNWGKFEREIGERFENYLLLNENEEIIACLPVRIIKAKRGKYLHLRHAPLLDWNDPEAISAFLFNIEKFAREEGLQFVRMSPLLPDSQENRELLQDLGLKRATSHDVDAEKTISLDLTKTEEELLANMRKNTRYSIRKAEKMGVKITSTDKSDRFDEFWEIFSEAVKRNKWVAYSKNYVKEEFETFSYNGEARMFFAEYEGKPIAASIFTYFNGQSVYHHSGSLTEYRNVPASYLLQWEAIKYAKENSMKIHNLWGVSPEEDKNHPWYGLSLFKRGFGGEEHDMVHAHDMVLHPWWYAVSTYEWLEKKIHGY